ncbi:activator of HSP90 ATPase [Amylibacter ulvae]|uniref:Activator of HSP90 ATPase n=2 Tax=Paramylibacter ulvae TaxID=1651968 RepID=A0ABQ3D5R0_9RHOB|nr:activator of HSP90 ATPase [Amylibacter ulvae]
MTHQKITISTTVNAPVAHVWQAYTSPADIMQWNFASDDWCCPSAETDLRIGGAHRARMEAKDGSMGFDFEATYEEMEPEKALTLAMTDGRKARTTFEAAGSGTKVTTTFDAETENAIDMQRDGWQAILDNFKAHTENQSMKG